jgi:pilus assembly protein CpaE
MARLNGSLITSDDAFKKGITGLLRSASLPVHLADERLARPGGPPPDIVVVDARGDLASALATVERMRAAAPASSVFFVARENNPDVIVRAMRAGANEFFTWPVAQEPFEEALRRADARRVSLPDSGPQGTTLVFFGAKGGSGTTTLAVNSAVEMARIGKTPTIAVVDLKPGLGEVALFLGVRSRYTLVDALDNPHRLDAEFLRELVVKHKSGVEILAASETFDRPGPSDTGAFEVLLALIGRQYDFVIIDGGSYLNPCVASALATADMVCLVATPDVPSVRNAQRLLDRIAQLGPSGERVRLLLNRAAEPYPIPPAQIESALGHPIFHTFPSDYRTVSTALNSGVPIALASNPAMAAQFDRFARRVLNPTAAAMPPRRSTLGLERIASMW